MFWGDGCKDWLVDELFVGHSDGHGDGPVQRWMSRILMLVYACRRRTSPCFGRSNTSSTTFMFAASKKTARSIQPNNTGPPSENI